MNEVEELRSVLQEYAEAVQRVEGSKRPFDGVLGLGRRPSDDPCHGVLEEKTAALMQRAEEETHAPEEYDGLVSALLRAGKAYVGPGYARLALIAVQRHALPLIPRMSPEGRRELLTWYEASYPKRERFPTQKQLIAALGKA